MTINHWRCSGIGNKIKLYKIWGCHPASKARRYTWTLNMALVYIHFKASIVLNRQVARRNGIAGKAKRICKRPNPCHQVRPSNLPLISTVSQKQNRTKLYWSSWGVSSGLRHFKDRGGILETGTWETQGWSRRPAQTLAHDPDAFNSRDAKTPESFFFWILRAVIHSMTQWRQSPLEIWWDSWHSNARFGTFWTCLT